MTCLDFPLLISSQVFNWKNIDLNSLISCLAWCISAAFLQLMTNFNVISSTHYRVIPLDRYDHCNKIIKGLLKRCGQKSRGNYVSSWDRWSYINFWCDNFGCKPILIWKLRTLSWVLGGLEPRPKQKKLRNCDAHFSWNIQLMKNSLISSQKGDRCGGIII